MLNFSFLTRAISLKEKTLRFITSRNFSSLGSSSKVSNTFKWNNSALKKSVYGFSNETCVPLSDFRYIIKYNISTSSARNLFKTQKCYQSHKGDFSTTYKHKTVLYYTLAIVAVTLGASFAAVPLYRIFCQAYSYGGTVQEAYAGSKVEKLDIVKDRIIKITFNADIDSSMQWNFRPQQRNIKVHPGETALAFYNAKNPTNKQVVGVSTYNVLPFEAGQYFNKIQCFCFEEQMLDPMEEVSMPVFFYIDPDFADDPKMEYINEIILSYTFFEVKEGMVIPLPDFMTK